MNGTENRSELKPWKWAKMKGQEDPIEIVSYPCKKGEDWVVYARIKVGDPTSAKYVNVDLLEDIFSPEEHPHFSRPKWYYSDQSNVFTFRDELPEEHEERK